MDNCMIWAGLFALAALDTLLRINMTLAIDKRYGALRTYLLAGGGQAILTALRDPVLISGAGMAGIGDNIDQWRLVILFGNGRLIHTLRH